MRDIVIDRWRNFAQGNFEFAKLLNKETDRSSCRLWDLSNGEAPVPTLPKHSAGALWLGWQKPRPNLACAIELSDVAFAMARALNDQRVLLMSWLLTLDRDTREAVIGAEYDVNFNYLVKPIPWVTDAALITLRRSELLPEYYVFQIGPDDDYEEHVTESDVFFYVGKRPEFRIAA